MPRQQTKRVNQNTSGSTSIQRAAPGVHASPVDRTVVPEISSATQLAQSLKAISPGFNKYIADKHSKFVESETLAGEQAATLSKDEVDEKIALGELQPEQSPYFQQAYMRQSGINAGKRRALQLMESYNDPEQFNMETGDINKFFGDVLDADIEGLDDDDFKVGYLNAVRGAEDKIRSDYTNKHIETVRKDVQEQNYQAFFNAFEEMGNSDNFDTANLKQLDANAKSLNLTNHEINSQAYTAAVAYSLSGDGHPEVFEMFKNKGENGLPSLYYTEAYGKQITAAQKQAEALKTSKSAVLNNQIRFQAENEWEDRLKATGGVYDEAALVADIFDKETNPDGRLTVGQAEKIQNLSDSMRTGATDANKKELYFQFKDRAAAGEDIVDEVRASDLTLGQINTLEKSSLDARKDMADQARIRSYLPTRPDLLHSEKPEDVKRAAQSFLDEELAATGGDVNRALLNSLDTLKKSGVLPPQVDSLLSTANPANGETWAQASNVYRILNQQSPVYLRQTFRNDKQSAMFDSYNAMVDYEGYTPEQALETLNSRTPQQAEAGLLAFNNPRMKSKMFNAISSEFGGNAQFGRLQHEVSEIIKNRLQMPDAPTFDSDLVEQAVERVEARYVELGGTWVDRAEPGANIDGLEDAVEDHLLPFYKELNPSIGMEAARIVPDSHTSSDGSWVILDKNGARLPGRIKPNELVTSYKIANGDLLSQQDNERLTVQGQYDELRDELERIDTANDGFVYWSEDGKEDPGYLRNMERREQVMKDVRLLQERLSVYPGHRRYIGFKDLFATPPKTK